MKIVDISERAAVVSGLPSEQPRYRVQHALRFQIHDEGHPHLHLRHGRAETGWEDSIDG
jgi:hypothetical protein